MVELVPETPRAKSILLDLPGWRGHRAGQHVDIRLTAEDGYQAQRSYSIGSAPEDDLLALTVERLDDGEVSPYLTEVIEPGDDLELRGPIGGYFVWEASQPRPLQLIAGGSGIVPLRAMLRHWAAADRPVPARVLYSARTLEDAIYREELLGLAAYDEIDVRIALTRSGPTTGRAIAGASTARCSTRRHGRRRIGRASTCADPPPSSRPPRCCWWRAATDPTASRPSASAPQEVE